MNGSKLLCGGLKKNMQVNAMDNMPNKNITSNNVQATKRTEQRALKDPRVMT